MHPRNPPPRAACTKNGGDSAMPKVLNRVLNAKTIATLTKPGTYADGGGLSFRIDDRGYRRWIWRGRVNGKAIVRGGWGVILPSRSQRPGKQLPGFGRT